jgi:hypothetical protein
MSAFIDYDRSALDQRRRALNAPDRIIVRVYSAVVLRLHQAGQSGPSARKTALAQTAIAVSKMTGSVVSEADIERALSANGYGRA